MGLGITIGFLIDQLENDEEGVEWFKEDLERVNRQLRGAGLAQHEEPAGGFEPLSYELYGYTGVHTLRRLAAYDAAGRGLPAPYLEARTTDDALVDAYYAAHEERRGLFGLRRSRKPGPYDHLMLHADNEGFYVPQDFPDPIGVELGSSQLLATECDRLAALVEVPESLDPDDEAVW